MGARSGARVLIIDESADERDILGLVCELELMKEVSLVDVPLLFFMVQGSTNHQDHLPSSFIHITRAILSLKQPVYGIALGELTPARASILEACDCILSDSPQENLTTRVLRPTEIASVCEILHMEAASMKESDVKKVKERLHLKKLSNRFPALARARCLEGFQHSDFSLFDGFDQVQFLPGGRLVIDI